MEPSPVHVEESALNGFADTVSKPPKAIEHQQQDRVHGYPGRNRSANMLSVSQDDSDEKLKNLKDKEMLHQVEQQGSWGSGWVEKPSVRLYSVSSMTVEVGDNPPAESLIDWSETEREATVQEDDYDNESEVKNITCIDKSDEFTIKDSNVDDSPPEEGELLHHVDKKECWESYARGKNTSGHYSLSSMDVEVGDSLPAESVAGLSEAEAALEDLDTFDGYEVTIVKDDVSPSEDYKTEGQIGQSVGPLSHTRDANFGLPKPSEEPTDSPSHPKSYLGDYVHGTPGRSNTTFVSEWVVKNASVSTSPMDKVHPDNVVSSCK